MPKYNQINEQLIHAIIQSKLQAVNDLVQYLGTSSIEPLEDRHFLMASQQMGGTFDVALGQSLYLALALHACSVTLDPVRGNIVMTLLKRYLDVYPQEPFAIQALITFHAQVKKQTMPAQPSAFSNTPFGQATASPALTWLNELEFMILNKPLAGIPAFKAYCQAQFIPLSHVVAMLKDNIQRLNSLYSGYDSFMRTLFSSDISQSLAAALMSEDLFNIKDAQSPMADSNFFKLLHGLKPTVSLADELLYEYFKAAVVSKERAQDIQLRFVMLKSAGFELESRIEQLKKDLDINRISEGASEAIETVFGVILMSDDEIAAKILTLVRQGYASIAHLMDLLNRLLFSKRLNPELALSVMQSILIEKLVPDSLHLLTFFYDKNILAHAVNQQLQLIFMLSMSSPLKRAMPDLEVQSQNSMAMDLLNRLVNTPYYAAAVSWLYDLNWLDKEAATQAINKSLQIKQYFNVSMDVNLFISRSLRQLTAILGGGDPDDNKAIALDCDETHHSFTAAQAWILCLRSACNIYTKINTQMPNNKAYRAALKDLNYPSVETQVGNENGHEVEFFEDLAYITALFDLGNAKNLSGLLSAKQKASGWRFIMELFRKHRGSTTQLDATYGNYWRNLLLATHPAKLDPIIYSRGNTSANAELIFVVLNSPRLRLDLNDKLSIQAAITYMFYDPNFCKLSGEFECNVSSFARWFIQADSLTPYKKRFDFNALLEPSLKPTHPFFSPHHLDGQLSVRKLKEKLLAELTASEKSVLADLRAKVILNDPCPLIDVFNCMSPTPDEVTKPLNMENVHRHIQTSGASAGLIHGLRVRLRSEPSPRDTALLLALSTAMSDEEFHRIATSHLLSVNFSGTDAQKAEQRAALCDALKLLSKDEFVRFKNRLISMLENDIANGGNLKEIVGNLIKSKSNLRDDNAFLVVLRVRKSHYDLKKTNSYNTVVSLCFPHQPFYKRSVNAVMFKAESLMDNHTKQKKGGEIEREKDQHSILNDL